MDETIFEIKDGVIQTSSWIPADYPQPWITQPGNWITQPSITLPPPPQPQPLTMALEIIELQKKIVSLLESQLQEAKERIERLEKAG
jgi:hypothetical protein